MKYLFIISIIGSFAFQFVFAQTGKMATIKGGTFVPLYGDTKYPTKVNDFKMDIYPVTNAEFEAFLQKYPKWKKGKVIKLYADEGYLYQFNEQSKLKDKSKANMPVTNVSWFVAKDYCACQGKRLPTMDEWEYAAMADATSKDARQKEEFNQYILQWYSKPNSYDLPIGSTFKNYWGIWDLHGLVWEWTLDYNSVLITDDSRVSSDNENNFFCGGAAINATDLTNYAAFMRYAFRGSLKSNYNVRNLGFRCAQSIKK